MYFRVVSVFLYCFFAINLYANVAQPGFWGAGGASSFSLLFEEDTSTYKKVQMKEEQVYIQLYKGYAVVKGVYTMYNTSDSAFHIISGYPLKGLLNYNTQHHLRSEILFDELYGFNVLINQNRTKISTNTSDDGNLWYVWDTEFKPKQSVEVSVYFIVNTNRTSITRGYDHSSMNGFIYLVETAATWKAPIEKGEIFIELKDDLDTEDIRLFYPNDVFMINRNHHRLYQLFKNLSPTYTDNIMIGYYKTVKDFEFGKIMENKTALFDEVDLFSSTVDRDEFYEAFEFTESIIDFSDIPSSIRWVVVGIFVIVFSLIFYLIIRLRKKRS